MNQIRLDETLQIEKDAFLGLLDQFGNQQMRVFLFLLERKDAEGYIKMSNLKIAKEVPCCRQTVLDAIKTLTQLGILTRTKGVLRFQSGSTKPVTVESDDES